MEEQSITHEISVTWRGKKFVVEMSFGATFEELGIKLQKLTAVKGDTMRLIVQSHKSSKLISPFSDEHSCLALRETSIFEGKSIRMMGVPKEELDQVLKNTSTDLRIAGFDEEERRHRQRMSSESHFSLKLPQGPYIFNDFRTLHLTGIELNPPASEALRLMHTLAADRGIVAVMNKHRWSVGIMTEMAPEGYVGVSPVCILGFNKNHGEEISLRLRTDDLKGFRKYESIKKTLLHELAHMVFSEHDANFYALDKQLNQEAATLDWTRSRSHTLSGAKPSQHYEAEFHISNDYRSSHKLGGSTASDLASARTASVAAAYQRLTSAASNLLRESLVNKPPNANVDPRAKEPDIENTNKVLFDNGIDGEAMESESYREPIEGLVSGRNIAGMGACEEPDPDDMEIPITSLDEPDPDDDEIILRINEGYLNVSETKGKENQSVGFSEPDPDDSEGIIQEEPDLDDSVTKEEGNLGQDSVGDLGVQELQRIQDSVSAVCNRLQKAIEMLQSEVNPSDAVRVMQTLFKIIRNVIEHPEEMKFRKLRKANPVIRRNITNYKATMEILNLIGFIEDTVLDEIGRPETYLVLKWNDPSLLWLAKSSLETCMAF